MTYQSPLAMRGWPGSVQNPPVEGSALVCLLCLTALCFVSLALTNLDNSIWIGVFGCIQLAAISTCIRGRDMARVRTIVAVYSLFLLLVTVVTYHWGAPPIAGFKPDLADSDGEKYYLQALTLSQGDIFTDFNLIHSNYFGYPVFLSIAFKYLSSDLIIGLLLNDVCMVLTIIALANCTRLVTGSPRAALFSGVAFMMTSVFVFYADVLLKDPLLVLGVTLVGYGYALLKLRPRTYLLPYSMLGAAILIFGTLRLPMLVLIPGGLFLLGRDVVRKGWLVIALLAVLATPAFSVFDRFTTFTFSDDFVSHEALKNTILAQAFAEGIDSTGLVGSLVGGYTDLPLFIRILTLPIPLTIQYFLPFDFWSTAFLEKNPILLFSSNLNFLWYGFVGVFALFSLANLSRIRPPILRHMFIMGAIGYAATAFTFGGATPRYGVPYLMLVFPAIGYWMAQWELGGVIKVRLNRFFLLYYSCFFVAGLVYLAFQSLR